MRKSDLVEAVADAADLSPRQADDAVSAIFDHITNALARKDSVNLVGFGSFITRERAARQGRNPQTGATIDIAASVLPVFKPGKKLKDALVD